MQLEMVTSVIEVYKPSFPTLVQLYLGCGQATEGNLLTGHVRGGGEPSFLQSEAF